MTEQTSRPGDRIAKVIARAGLASRRDAEAMVTDLRVQINGRTVSNVATNVTATDRVTVDGVPLPRPEAARLWLYHKPSGLVTSARDEKGRETVFDTLPEEMGRVLSVGRLDLTTEGLLLLTNDGDLKRQLELPSTGWLRRYRVRVNGRPQEAALDRLRAGIEVAGEHGPETFAPMQVTIDRQQGANAWLTIGIREGRNREVRRALEVVELWVNRLIRVSYGPFQLGNLAAGEVEEVKPRILGEQLGGIFDGELAQGRKGGPMATNEGDDEKKDRSAGRDGTGPAKGRKPRPSGDRLVEHGRGGAGGDKSRGGPKGDAPKRADSAEIRSDRAARPDRPRTAKPPVTRNDGDGSKPARPRRDLDARSGKPGDKPGGERKPWSKDGPRQDRDGPRKPRPAEGAKPWRKDGERPDAKPGGDRAPWAKDGAKPTRPARDGERKPWSKDGARPRPDGDGKPRSAGAGKPWAKDGERKRDGDRPARSAGEGDRKPWAKDGDRPARPAGGGGRKPWAKDGPRPARDGDRKAGDGARADRAGGKPARDGARAGAVERPKETKGERTTRLRQDSSVSLRKGGQKGRGQVKPKKAPSTKRMRKPEDGAEE